MIECKRAFVGMAVAVVAFALWTLPAVAAGSCPKIAILSDAAQLVQADAKAKQTGAIDYVASLGQPKVSCVQATGAVQSSLSFQVEGASGEKQPRPASLPYFVAIMDGSQVWAKQVFTVTLRFTANERAVKQTETVERVRIPLKAGKSGGDYRILVGFQLTPEQIAHNRNKRAP